MTSQKKESYYPKVFKGRICANVPDDYSDNRKLKLLEGEKLSRAEELELPRRALKQIIGTEKLVGLPIDLHHKAEYIVGKVTGQEWNDSENALYVTFQLRDDVEIGRAAYKMATDRVLQHLSLSHFEYPIEGSFDVNMCPLRIALCFRPGRPGADIVEAALEDKSGAQHSDPSRRVYYYGTLVEAAGTDETTTMSLNFGSSTQPLPAGTSAASAMQMLTGQGGGGGGGGSASNSSHGYSMLVGHPINMPADGSLPPLTSEEQLRLRSQEQLRVQAQEAFRLTQLHRTQQETQRNINEVLHLQTDELAKNARAAASAAAAASSSSSSSAPPMPTPTPPPAAAAAAAAPPVAPMPTPPPPAAAPAPSIAAAAAAAPPPPSSREQPRTRAEKSQTFFREQQDKRKQAKRVPVPQPEPEPAAEAEAEPEADAEGEAAAAAAEEPSPMMDSGDGGGDAEPVADAEEESAEADPPAPAATAAPAMAPESAFEGVLSNLFNNDAIPDSDKEGLIGFLEHAQKSRAENEQTVKMMLDTLGQRAKANRKPLDPRKIEELKALPADKKRAAYEKLLQSVSSGPGTTGGLGRNSKGQWTKRVPGGASMEDEDSGGSSSSGGGGLDQETKAKLLQRKERWLKEFKRYRNPSGPTGYPTGGAAAAAKPRPTSAKQARMKKVNASHGGADDEDETAEEDSTFTDAFSKGLAEQRAATADRLRNTVLSPLGVPCYNIRVGKVMQQLFGLSEPVVTLSAPLAQLYLETPTPSLTSNILVPEETEDKGDGIGRMSERSMAEGMRSFLNGLPSGGSGGGGGAGRSSSRSSSSSSSSSSSFGSFLPYTS